MIEEYPRCPRCLSPWKEGVGKVKRCLTNCGMAYAINSTFYQTPILSCEKILREEDILYWYVNSHICIYAVFTNDGSETQLPWLPFDIDPDKLKKYLLFT